jgi:hypothetical protein
MSELGLFMLPSEISWLDRITRECGLTSYTAQDRSGFYHFTKKKMVEAKSFHERHFYLSPNDCELGPLTQTRPLIGVWLPIADGNNLCMTTVGISRPWDEALLDMYEANLPIYRRLVRKIKKECQLGVFATNMGTGDRSWYPGIAISQGVVANIGNFAALKPVHCDTFSEFTLPGDGPQETKGSNQLPREVDPTLH